MSENATAPNAEASSAGSELGSWTESGSSTPAPAAPVAETTTAPAAGAETAAAAPSSAAAVASTSQPASPVEAKPEPFSFAGKVWESREKAEHWARTTQGIGRAAQEHRMALLEARQQLAAYEREIQELRAAQEQATQQPVSAKGSKGQGSQPDPNEPLGDDELAEVFGILQQNNGPAVATRFLSQQMQLRAERTASQRFQELEEKFTKSISPLLEQHESAQQIAQADRLIGAMSTYTVQGGRAAFPELQDQDALAEIGQIWADLNLPQENLLSITGLTQAIALYRMAKGEQAHSVGASAAPVTYNSPAASSSAAAVASSSGDAPRSAPRPMTPQEKTLADIRNAGVPKSNPDLPWAEQ